MSRARPYVMLTVLAIVGITILIAAPAANGATANESDSGALRFVADDGTVVDMPLRRTEVRVEISAFVAGTVVEQWFSNPSDVPVEAIYTFPLGETAAVNAYEIQVGDRVIAGKIFRRDEARRVYDEAKAEGLQAALLDQDRPNVFTQHVANLVPGHDVLVRLRTVQVVDYIQGTYEYVFPLVVGPRYASSRSASPPVSTPTDPPPGPNPTVPRQPARHGKGGRNGTDVSIEVTLDAGIPIVSCGSPSHDVVVERPADTRRSIRLEPHDTIPNKDFVLRWDVFSTDPALGVLTHRTGVDGTFTLLVQPRAEVSADEAMPKEIYFVLDTSGSMAGRPLAMSRGVMRRALQTLGPRDTFNLIQFAGSTARFERVPQTSERASVDRALKWIKKLEGGGGTELLGGLREAVRRSPESDRYRMVVFLTDGYIGDEDSIFREIAQLPDDVRIFTLGIGSSVNHHLLRGMAKHGRGAYTFLANETDETTAVDRVTAWLTRPYLTDLEVDWGALPVGAIEPRTVPDLFSGQNLSLVGRYYGAAEGVVTVRGRLAGRPWEQQISVLLPEQETAHAALESVWARRQIDGLLDENPGAVDDDTRERVIELALEHSLMSAYTSFVAVEYRRVVNPGGNSRSVVQSVPRPDGMQDGPEDTGTAPAATTTTRTVSEIAERVRVMATSNVVELESASSMTRFTDEFVADMPVPGRFYQKALTLAPGVNDADGDGNPTVHGSRSRDFRGVVSGVSNVDPLTGRFMTLTSANSIESMEVVSSGAGVEFGRAQGGFARIVRKQGTNDLEGTVELALRSSVLDGSSGAGAGEAPSNDGVRPSLLISGPILRNKLWFRVAHGLTRWEQPVDTLGSFAIRETSGEHHSDSLTWQVSPRHKLQFGYENTDERRDPIDAGSMLQPESGTAIEGRSRGASVRWVHPVSPKLLIESVVSWRRSASDVAATTIGDGAANLCTSDPVYADAQCFDSGSGQVSGTVRRGVAGAEEGWGLSSTSTWYAGQVLGATHQVRFGFEAEGASMSRDVAVRSALFRGADGLYLERLPLEPSTAAEVRSGRQALWVEDKLKPASNVSIRVGLRVERERLDASNLAFEQTNLSPVLTVSWDPSSTGRLKFWATAQRNYGAVPPAVPLLALEPATLDRGLRDVDGQLLPLPGAAERVNRTRVDPDLESPYQDEWVVGLEYELFMETALRVSWIDQRNRRQLAHRAVSRDAGVSEVEIGNLVTGRTRALTIALDRRQYRSWEMKAAYTWTLAESSGEPLNLLLGDERDLLSPLQGRDSGVPTHQFDLGSVFLTPWGFRVGVRLGWQSGLPWSPFALELDYGLEGAPGARLDYLDDERNGETAQSFWNADLRVSRQINAGGGVAIEVAVEAFNLLDDDTLQVYSQRWQLGRQIDGAFDATRRYGRSYQLGLRLSF